MSNRPYKNIKRFVDNLSKDVEKRMDDNPLIDVLKVDSSVDLLGKHVDDLVSAFKVFDNTVSATLPYVEGYTGYSGNPEEQEGWYLPFTVLADFENATITVKTSKGTYTLDEDKTIVLRVGAKKNFKFTVTAKTAKETISESFETDLKFEDKPTAQEVEA